MSLALKWFQHTKEQHCIPWREAAGTILAMSTSAQIATSIGWSYIFFLSGALGLCLCSRFTSLLRKIRNRTPSLIEERDMIVETRLKKLHPLTRRYLGTTLLRTDPSSLRVAHTLLTISAYLALSLGPYFFKSTIQRIFDPSSTLGVFACPLVVSLTVLWQCHR